MGEAPRYSALECMSNSVYELNLAGHVLRYAFRRARTKYYFMPLLRRSESPEWDIRMSAEELERAKTLVPPHFSEAYAEYRGLLAPTARALQACDCCILHATAIVINHCCWLLAAPSGTGKTTQYRNWLRLHPGELGIVSGDMPVLELRNAGVWVHPSPWNGKERYRGFEPAKLAGVVLLKQGKENKLTTLTVRQAIEPLFRQLAGLPATEQQTLAVCRVLDGVLRAGQCWRFENRGDDASTELLREAIRREEDDHAL